MNRFEGVFTALVTPFMCDQLDEVGLAQNIRFQIEQGIDGVVALGTTGESATLSADEQRKVIEIAVQETKGKIPLIVGTGTNCTRQTIEKTRLAQDLGAAAALIVTPYYNRPTQEGIFRHFEVIAKSVNLPFLVYNVPGRCAINIELPTLKRIAELPHIIGIKEASGNINQIVDVLEMCADKPNFSVLCGDDALTLPCMALGGQGVVSVISNLVPRQVSRMVKAALTGQYVEARAIHQQLLPFCRAAFLETNPSPIKTAMGLYGMPAGACRLPLCEMNPTNIELLRQVLINLMRK